MFFFLSKLLSFLINPFTYLVLAGLLICILIFKKKNYLRLLIATFFYLFFITSPLSQFPLSLWENTQQRSLPSKLDTIVILGGGGIYYSKGNEQFVIGGSFSRSLEGIRLFKKSNARYLLISGGEPSELAPDLESEALSTKKLALEMGVKEEQILIENKSRNTYEEANYIQEYIKRYDIQHITLVTDAVHMKRALDTFKKFGYDLSAYPVNYNITAKTSKFKWSIRNALYWEILLHEWFGYFAYYLKGYL